MNVLDNFIKIKNSINSLSNTVKIIVVSKTFDINIINPIIKYGHNHFGENKVQEATIKWQPIISRYPSLKLHLIGNLQSNKAKDAVRLFNYIHSLSSEKLANILMKEENLNNNKLKYFVQVNFSNLKERNGIKPNEATSFIKYCINDLKLEIIGLMCIPPLNDNPNSYFCQLKKIANENNLHELSMGMSSDYLDAVKNGSTFVRIGSKIFGERTNQ